MFTKSAKFYDALYTALGKDYEAEAARVVELAGFGDGGDMERTLLDVACGTGEHLKYLGAYFAAEGLDVEESMLALCREKLGNGVTLHAGSMVDFELGRQFDVVTCLFSSIGYLGSVGELVEAVANFARHTKPGGVVLVEPWLTRGEFKAGYVHALYVDEPELKIARLSKSEVVDERSVIEFQYLVATPSGGIEHLVEPHVLSLFTFEEYEAAFEKAGLAVEVDEKGLMNRGLFIGRKGFD